MSDLWYVFIGGMLFGFCIGEIFVVILVAALDRLKK